MSEKGIQVQRLLTALAKHGDLVAEAFEGTISGGDKHRNSAIEALMHINAIKPYEEDRYTLNPRLREFIADHLSSYQAFQALRQVSAVMRQAREQWNELRRLKSTRATRDIYKLESALDESVVEIAYSVDNNIALLHSLISTQYGNVEDFGSKLRQNRYYANQINVFLRDVSAIDALVELIGDEATGAGLPHIRHMVVRRLGSRRLQWSASIKDAQFSISKRLFDAQLMEIRIKRLSHFALWLSKNKTSSGWDLNIKESVPLVLIRPEPVLLRPQPDVLDSDPEMVKSLISAIERMPPKPCTKKPTKDLGPQMIIEDDEDETIDALDPHQIALQQLIDQSRNTTKPISLLAWKNSQELLREISSQAWLMYACTQLQGSGLKLNYIGELDLDPFPVNEFFHDIEVCSVEVR